MAVLDAAGVARVVLATTRPVRYWLISRRREVYESVLADPDSLADVPGLTVGYSHNGEGFAGAASDLLWELYGLDPEPSDSSIYDDLVEASMPPAERARRDSPAADDHSWEGDEDQRYPRLMALMDAQSVPPLFVSRSTFTLSAASGTLRLSDGVGQREYGAVDLARADADPRRG